MNHPSVKRAIRELDEEMRGEVTTTAPELMAVLNHAFLNGYDVWCRFGDKKPRRFRVTECPTLNKVGKMSITAKLKEVRMDKFWLIWREDGEYPKFRHASEEMARQEAERLAEKHPGKRFHVLESIASCAKRSVDWEEHIIGEVF